jgi:hypothetical protein
VPSGFTIQNGVAGNSLEAGGRDCCRGGVTDH